MLGLTADATPDEVRAAYHRMARQHHPDLFPDPEQQEEAQRRLIAINLAYRQAIKMAEQRHNLAYQQELSPEDAKILARKLMRHDSPAVALRQLLRASERDAEWYYLQGLALMALDQFESAHQAFREAVRRRPESLEYRRGALDAAVALRESRTIRGRIKKVFSRRRRG